MNDYVAALLFFLPAGVANMSPVIANKFPWLNQWETPMDFGKTWRGKPVFGKNKRLRGIVFGTIMGGLTAVIVSKFNANTVVTLAPFWMGSLLGFGALLGDAIESFFKRRRGIDAGQSWFPFDQTDYIIGGLLIALPFVAIPLWAVGTIIITYFGLHLVIAYMAYLCGLKSSPI